MLCTLNIQIVMIWVSPVFILTSSPHQCPFWESPESISPGLTKKHRTIVGCHHCLPLPCPSPVMSTAQPALPRQLYDGASRLPPMSPANNSSRHIATATTPNTQGPSVYQCGEEYSGGHEVWGQNGRKSSPFWVIYLYEWNTEAVLSFIQCLRSVFWFVFL